jgi:peptide deformylase
MNDDMSKKLKERTIEFKNMVNDVLYKRIDNMPEMIKITHNGIIPVRETPKLVKSTDPILKEFIPEFDFRKHNATDIAHQIIEVLQANSDKAFAVAAPQVGLKHRVFVMGLGDEIVAFFNPQILEQSEKDVDMDEGCLSYPYLFLKVKRPESIVVKWQDYTGKEHTAKFDGMTARIFQHEFDHLNGISFTERVGSTTLMLAKQKAEKYAKKALRVK